MLGCSKGQELGGHQGRTVTPHGRQGRLAGHGHAQAGVWMSDLVGWGISEAMLGP